jgi:predicted DNA-binding transcriptional regulator YafY
MKRLLNLYCNSNKPVEIIYIAKTGVITHRIISVLHVQDTSIIAYCHLRRTKRTFLLANILSFSPCKRNKENVVI